MALYEEELLWTRGLSMVSLLRVEWKRVLMRWQTWADSRSSWDFSCKGSMPFTEATRLLGLWTLDECRSA